MVCLYLKNNRCSENSVLFTSKNDALMSMDTVQRRRFTGSKPIQFDRVSDSPVGQLFMQIATLF